MNNQPSKPDMFELTLVFLAAFLFIAAYYFGLTKFLSGSWSAYAHSVDVITLVMFTLAVASSWSAWRYDRNRATRVLIGSGYAALTLLLFLVVTLNRLLAVNPQSGAQVLFLFFIVLGVTAWFLITRGYTRRAEDMQDSYA